ncbi:MAG TPA: hypothetical protein VD999_02320 [Vitreimonas sp.]|nr:hypothetical protein [Vitreimonas sp.]
MSNFTIPSEPVTPNPFSSRWLWYLLAFALVGIVIALTLRLLTPPISEVPTTEFTTANADGSTTNFAGFRYVGEPFTQPATLPLLSATPFATAEIESEIVNDFQLQPHPSSKGLWVGDRYSLSKDVNTGELSLTQDVVATDSAGIITKTEALDISQGFVDEYLSALELKALENQITYYAAAVESEEVDSSQAQMARVPFSYVFEDIPVFFNYQANPPVVIIVNARQQVQSATFTPSYSLTRANQNVELISVNEALENLTNRNQGSIIAAYDDTALPLDIRDVADGEMTSVSLEYRTDSKSNLAYPFYHFTGTAKNTTQDSFTIEVLTPAVRTGLPL